ncbi:MAG: hypothetical protein H6727_05835 [Myxococcales bacterium]|nr:hypothetical protein [Myxococcales bacterium]
MRKTMLFRGALLCAVAWLWTGFSSNAIAQNKDDANRSRLYAPKTPSSMQNVFRPPSGPQARPQVFNYTQYCGRNDVDKHTVYLCVLEDGRIFGGVPPNIDQNDRIIVFLLVRRWLSHLYSLHMTLRSQSTILPSSDVVRENELDSKKDDVFIVKRYVFGPYSQGPLQLTVSRPSIARGGLGRVFATHVIPINALVQFNVAIAFVGLTPVKTEFGLFRERGSNITRIARKDEGLFQLDFILIAKFYSWQVWDPMLFAGRDVLKPPSFLQRFNLNIGFSFKDLFTSFFLGIGFEVNQGLDIVVGVNFRAEQVLSGGFEIGNAFDGEASEIPVRLEIRPAFYVGLSITPEIFRSIFKLLSTNALFT